MPIEIIFNDDQEHQTTTTTTTPVPQPIETCGDPSGTIPTTLRIAFGRGAPWADVNRWNEHFLAAGRRHDVPPEMLKAMAVIESGGQMIPNLGGSGAFGIMQIKPAIWGERSAAFGYDLRTPAGNIGMAGAILGGHVQGVRGSTPEERFLSTYYPTAGLDVPGEDGHTPRQYLADMHELMRIITAAASGTTPADATRAELPQGDVVDLLFGGQPYNVSADFGIPVTWSCPGCYNYFEAYGLDRFHHYAIDCAADAGDGAPVFAPFDGTVTCAGTGVGPGSWGTGCAEFDRDNNYGGKAAGTGHGRLEIINEAGTASLIMGHMLTSVVRSGDRVTRGQLIGHQGGMNGSHVHLESRHDNGRKIGNPRELFGRGPIVPARLPYNWTDNPNTVKVTALQDVKVFQRADPSSPVLDTIPAGDTFTAVAVVPGNDRKPWWLGVNNGRVPMAGTKADGWPS